MNWVLPTIVAVVFASSLTWYYMLLRKRTEWKESLLREKLELTIAPLPIAVGLMGVFIGYEASNRSSAVAEQAFERTAISEVRRTSEAAIEMYSELLIVVQNAYFEAMLLAPALPSKQEYESSGYAASSVISTLITHHANLSASIREIDEVLRQISLNTFANSCYRQQWEFRHNELLSTRISERFGLVSSSPGDFLTTGAFLRSASIQMQSILEALSDGEKEIASDELVFIFQQPLTAFGVAQSAEEETLHRNFLFLGNLIRFDVEDDNGDSYVVSYGGAILADLIVTVPDQEDFRNCLVTYFEDHSSLMMAAREHRLMTNPRDAAPTVVRIANEMAERLVIPVDGGRFSPAVARLLHEYQ